MKKYRLLRDLPGLEKGLEFCLICGSVALSGDQGPFDIDSPKTGSYFEFDDYFIIKHPDWFEEIKEPVKEYTKEDILDFARYYYNTTEDFNHRSEDVFKSWLIVKK